MSRENIKQWLDYNNRFFTNYMLNLMTDCLNDLQPQRVSVDNIKLNINLIVPASQYEGPDYYKGYHQAREDMLSTLPPSE